MKPKNEELFASDAHGAWRLFLGSVAWFPDMGDAQSSMEVSSFHIKMVIHSSMTCMIWGLGGTTILGNFDMI